MQALRRATLLACLLAGAVHVQDRTPLRAAVDGTFAPFAFPSLSGGMQGLSVELFTEVARRLHSGWPENLAGWACSGVVADHGVA